MTADLYDPVGAPVYHDLAGHDTNEVRELLQVARATAGPVLELAAGSGRLTMPLLALGREVTALDLSASMLALLRERLDSAPSLLGDRCTPVEADMSDFALAQRFPLIVLGTTSVSLLTDAQRHAMLRRVREHLAEGGRFALTTVQMHPRIADSQSMTWNFTAPSGRRYEMRERWDAHASLRTITVTPDEEPGDQSVVCTSQIRVVPHDVLEADLACAGLHVTEIVELPPAGPHHQGWLLVAEVAR